MNWILRTLACAITLVFALTNQMAYSAPVNDVGTYYPGQTKILTYPQSVWGNGNEVGGATSSRDDLVEVIEWNSTGAKLKIIKGVAGQTVKVAITVDYFDASKNFKRESYVFSLKVKTNPIQMTESSISMRVGETHCLEYKGTVAGKPVPEATWISSKSSVASVSSTGFVTAKSEGTATITAKSTDGETTTCTVTVSGNTGGGGGSSSDETSAEVVDLGLSVKWTTCNLGATTPTGFGNKYAWGATKPSYSYTDDSPGKTWCYESSLESNGIIKNGHFTPEYDACTQSLGKGYRVPTKEEWEELANNCTWESVTISGTKCIRGRSNKNGKTIVFPKTETQNAGTSLEQKRFRSWSCTHYFYGRPWAYYFIDGYQTDEPASLSDNVTWCYPLRAVYDPSSDNILVDKITLNHTDTTLDVGETIQLTASIDPSNATDKSVSWLSNDVNVATVTSSGKVKAIGAGTATITVTANDGGNAKATCQITVNSSYEFTVDGIRYREFNTRSVEVVPLNNSKYYGNIVIPSKVSYKNVKYCVRRIADYAFENCTALSSITLGDEVGGIGEGAFAGCTGLNSIGWPNNSNVHSYKDAFKDCKNLKRVEIFDINNWNGNTFHDSAVANPCWAGNAELFLNGDKLTSAVITNEWHSKFALYVHCSSIETAIILKPRESLVGGRVFQGCVNLKEIQIPSTMKLIDGYTFAWCPELKVVNCWATTPPNLETGWRDQDFSSYYAFYGSNPDKATLHVPIGTKQLYETAPGWKEFGNIVDDLDSAGIDEVNADEMDGPLEYFTIQGTFAGSDVENLSSIKASKSLKSS